MHKRVVNIFVYILIHYVLKRILYSPSILYDQPEKICKFTQIRTLIVTVKAVRSNNGVVGKQLVYPLTYTKPFLVINVTFARNYVETLIFV